MRRFAVKPRLVRPRSPRSWVVVIAAVFAVLQLANISGRDTPDTKNYLSYALSLRGESKQDAAALTIDYACAGKASIARRNQSVHVMRFHRPSPTRRVMEECRRDLWRGVSQRLRARETAGHTVPFMPPRFMRIFEARPGYPALLVPFITVLGVKWGLWASGVAITVTGGVLAFLVLRTLRAPTGTALAGQALFYVLPCGTTAMRPMTEGLLLTLTLAALWGCAQVLEGRARAGTWLVGASLAALFTVKHSQALFLGLCLGGACAVIGVRRGGLRRPLRKSPRPWLRTWLRQPLGTLAVVAGCGAVATVLMARALHYPSESESLQDLLTAHFSRPDRAHPWPEFLHLEVGFWVEWLRRQLWEPVFLTAVVAAAWGALRGRPAFGGFLLAAAFTGVLNQAGHPDINIWGDRLIVVVWLLPVLGIPLLVEGVVRPRVRASAGTVPGPLRRDAEVAR
ncbi:MULTISPECIES: hypothetical protein [Streptomyces]|uniref:Glycosyltransferase RgtA/B/C/D-like domain-containing protein n=1 Tax=Streptomyces dengpaensis TaxID=2049881 RepID=A0ABM6T2R8_9ACTN|nr:MULTISPECIES: hypothetical protein [Streptomyces]AVH61403.1 hypothetical protein C4B68_24650 [Streptomyces dengpaensis]PIB06104.1 hypothetical protein B1C81_26370 [Streptomyces sp. HG99]